MSIYFTAVVGLTMMAGASAEIATACASADASCVQEGDNIEMMQRLFKRGASTKAEKSNLPDWLNNLAGTINEDEFNRLKNLQTDDFTKAEQKAKDLIADVEELIANAESEEDAADALKAKVAAKRTETERLTKKLEADIDDVIKRSKKTLAELQAGITKLNERAPTGELLKEAQELIEWVQEAVQGDDAGLIQTSGKRFWDWGVKKIKELVRVKDKQELVDLQNKNNARLDALEKKKKALEHDFKTRFDLDETAKSKADSADQLATFKDQITELRELLKQTEQSYAQEVAEESTLKQNLELLHELVDDLKSAKKTVQQFKAHLAHFEKKMDDFEKLEESFGQLQKDLDTEE